MTDRVQYPLKPKVVHGAIHMVRNILEDQVSYGLDQYSAISKFVTLVT